MEGILGPDYNVLTLTINSLINLIFGVGEGFSTHEKIFDTFLGTLSGVSFQRNNEVAGI